MSTKIVFCGGGPMGEGILEGLLRNVVALPEDVTVNELRPGGNTSAILITWRQSWMPPTPSRKQIW